MSVPFDPTSEAGIAFDEKRTKDAQRVLFRLARIQELAPHLRIGQVINTATRLFNDDHGSTTELFYVENDVLVQALIMFEETL